MPIKSVYIQNFKSIRDSGQIEIRPINVLIGPNGVGKSNFISFFKLLNSIYEQRLRNFVADNGYEDRMLYFGRKKSKFLAGGIIFKPDNGNVNNRYDFKIVPQAQSTGFYFETEKAGYNIYSSGVNEFWDYMDLGSTGSPESNLKIHTADRSGFLRLYFNKFKVFHFHDTSASSPLKQVAKTYDYKYFREDGSNLAAFLYKIKDTHPSNFKMIEYTIRSVAPFFDRFDLQPDEKNPEIIFLNWLEKGSDEYFNAHNLSDGTLRFIALTTLLLQPDLPKTIIIDEPELGLHPAAINKLAAMIQSVSETSQIIVSTQSVNFLDQFNPEDILVVEREDNQTVFKRLNSEQLQGWLKEYTISDLWVKNVLGGRPK